MRHERVLREIILSCGTFCDAGQDVEGVFDTAFMLGDGRIPEKREHVPPRLVEFSQSTYTDRPEYLEISGAERSRADS